MFFQGASGRSYDYRSVDPKNWESLPLGGGNYLFTRRSDRGLEIVCAGETEDSWNIAVFMALWHMATTQYGATGAYVHVNPDQRARQIESWDLVEKHRPALNVDLLGEHALALSGSLMLELDAEALADCNPRMEWRAVSPAREPTDFCVA